MLLYTIMAIMVAVALAFIVVPLHRRQSSLGGPIAFVIVSVGLGAGLYAWIGKPNVEAGRSEISSIDDMVASLEARLLENPQDVDGWKMLGRSYLQMQRFPESINAFEKAVALEDGRNGATLISLGEAVLSADPAAMAGRAGQLFESGLALSPNNPQGLFFGGLTALQRGDRLLAADRWDALLALSPPEEIRGVLEQRVAEWRGEAAPTPAAPSAVVTVDVNFVAQAAEGSAAGDSVFIIARDPAQPSPPVAVTRRTFADLPGQVVLTDGNAMVPGRVPSAFEELEIVVRVSASGQPIAQAGDWYGSSVVRPAEQDSVAIIVDQQVPGT